MTHWHIDRNDGSTKIKDADGNTVLWTQHTHLRGKRTDEEVMAIASLAAAAPDLLEALKSALAVHGEKYSWGAAALAAIAKAST